MRNFLLFLCLLVQPAWAQDKPISPAEFEALVMGRTLMYSSASGEYGAEEYLEDRRVRWSYLDGECTDGRWFDADDQVCFVYDGIDVPQCWKFYLRNDKLMARFENNPTSAELYETRRRDQPLFCYGPEIGV
ncbi:MAG: hypothetical protein HKN27_13700 [Silicimonas sp.]|nr:hypothetical protein [Silicimonas sp.]